MIFDLVEAAQEFLSEIAPANDATSTVSQICSWQAIEMHNMGLVALFSCICIVKL